jgi:hypothetical protein
MKKLKINQLGLFINIPGIASFRTPAIVDVTKINNETLMAELRKQGITNVKIYKDGSDEIIVGKKINKNLDTVKTEVVNILNIDTLNKISDEQKLHKEVMERIENLLIKFLESKETLQPQEFKKGKKTIEEDLSEFIPSIDLENVKTKGKFESRIINKKT